MSLPRGQGGNLTAQGVDMKKTVGMILLLLGLSGAAFAGTSTAAPEIDATTGVSALALLGGACFIIRARKKR